MSEQTTPNIIFRLEYEKYSKDRNPYYACKQNGKKRNIVEYIETGSKQRLNIVDYTGNKEKSSGAFDRKGLMDNERLEKMKERLRKTHSVIWHGVISFKEEFGEDHMRCYEDAYNLMKTQLPKFIKSAGLDYSNVAWFAGMHQNTENRHIHLVFCERRGTHKRQKHKSLCFSQGKLPKEAFAEFKFNMESWLSGTWQKVVQSRDKINFGGNDRETLDKYYSNRLQKDIIKLADLLPKEGRLSYNSANMDELKPLVRQMVNDILNSDGRIFSAFHSFKEALRERDEETKRLCKTYRLNSGSRLLEDKVTEDLYARLGNQIIRFAAQYKNDIKAIDNKRSGRIATKHIKRRRMNGMLSETLNLAAALTYESYDYFWEYLEKLKQHEREQQQQYEDEIEM